MSETAFPLSIVNVTDCLVTGEFLRADIVFVSTCPDQHLPHGSNHNWRPCQVVDRALQRWQMPPDHILVDEPGFTCPRVMGVLHLRHGCDEMQFCVLPGCLLQQVQKSCILGAAVGIEEVELVRKILPCGLADNAHKRRNPDSTSQKNGWFRAVSVQRE